MPPYKNHMYLFNGRRSHLNENKVSIVKGTENDPILIKPTLKLRQDLYGIGRWKKVINSLIDIRHFNLWNNS